MKRAPAYVFPLVIALYYPFCTPKVQPTMPPWEAPLAEFWQRPNDLASRDLSVRNVTTVDPSRTFWDKVVILHGLRRWWEHRGELRGGGQRVSRHYYDVSRLLDSEVGREAANDLEMAQDCVRHARMFFNRPDFDLSSAVPGSFALTPHDGMMSILERDYEAMSGMVFGAVPPFKHVITSISELEQQINEPH